MHDEETDSTAPPMYQWACDLFPIHRSLTGEGVRETLRYIKKLLPDLAMHEVPSGTKACDWTVPKEWAIRKAVISFSPFEAEGMHGKDIVDLKSSNLHVVQYSIPVAGWLCLADLEPNLHSLPEQPDAIPYVTSYYKERWGFCLSHRQRMNLKDGLYYVRIDSELKDGHLTYGELIIPGAEDGEVLLATNICHPSMANNEISGPVVVTALAQWLASKPRRRTYRILYLPETIGALVYLSRHWSEMIERTIAGYQVTCVGDDRTYGYLPSRKGGTLADRAAFAALTVLPLPCDLSLWSYLDRGSDERQWCAPGVDLPVGSIMRSKYGTYPEYHTSKDDLSLISQKGLEGSLTVYKRAIEIIEANRVYKATNVGEPQLCKYGLYPEDLKGQFEILNVLAYADGTRDLIELAETLNRDVLKTRDIAEKLREHGLLEIIR